MEVTITDPNQSLQQDRDKDEFEFYARDKIDQSVCNLCVSSTSGHQTSGPSLLVTLWLLRKPHREQEFAFPFDPNAYLRSSVGHL